MVSLERTALERDLDGLPDWVISRRRAGFEAFERSAMPSPTEELWRYIDLDFDLHDLHLADAPGVAMGTSPYVGDVDHSVIIDGSVISIAEPPAGVKVSRLAEAVHELDDTQVGWGVGPNDIFAAAHRAFGTDGLAIRTDRNGGSSELIVVEVQATTPDTVSFPHLSIVLAENSELHLLVVFRSAEGFMVMSPQIEALVGDGARLRLTTLQNLGRATHGIGYQRLRLGRDAGAVVGEVGLGGALGRLDIGVDLDGDGSSVELDGVSFGDREQVMDYRMVIHHRGRNTSSNVFLKGAVEDDAESVFTGLLKIHEGATNTSAFETNRNLVLSEGAKAHSVPNLEILCDDVVCGHGSTVGPLESEHLYYLQSRGLSPERAERLLVRGFFEEVIGKLPAQLVAEPVRRAVNAKFVEAQVEGRV